MGAVSLICCLLQHPYLRFTVTRRRRDRNKQEKLISSCRIFLPSYPILIWNIHLCKVFIFFSQIQIKHLFHIGKENISSLQKSVWACNIKKLVSYPIISVIFGFHEWILPCFKAYFMQLIRWHLQFKIGTALWACLICKLITCKWIRHFTVLAALQKQNETEQ